MRALVLFSLAATLVAGCGGSSAPAQGGSTPAPSGPSTAPSLARTTFVDQTALRNIDYDYGFSPGGEPMVRQFAGGGAAGDIDSDGDIDLFILRGDLGPNLIFLNEGGTTFREAAAAAGLAGASGAANGRHSGPVFADLDGDGDLDLIFAGVDGDAARLFLNDGAGRFHDATPGSGFDAIGSIHTISLALGDYDGDGDLDVAMAHWGTPRDPDNPGETETLWRNDTTTGGVKFTPTSAQSNISSLLALGSGADFSFTPSFVDFDGDRDQDLLMASDFGGSRLFLNNGDGSFAAGLDQPDDENGMGAAVGDYDNDGDPDWFVSSINGNRLYENLGGGRFRRASQSGVEAGGWGWGACFADFNADGLLDIYQTNGWDQGQSPSASPFVEDASRLWMNRGDGTFTDEAAAFNIVDTKQGRGVICDDFNNDGDIDVLLLTAEPMRSAIYWDNQLSNASILRIELQGRAPNTHAIGARIEVTANGVKQTRFVGVNSNFTSHSSTRAVFGLAGRNSASVRVVWPDGVETVLASASANQTLTLSQPGR